MAPWASNPPSSVSPTQRSRRRPTCTRRPRSCGASCTARARPISTTSPGRSPTWRRRGGRSSSRASHATPTSGSPPSRAGATRCCPPSTPSSTRRARAGRARTEAPPERSPARTRDWPRSSRRTSTTSSAARPSSTSSCAGSGATRCSWSAVRRGAASRRSSVPVSSPWSRMARFRAGRHGGWRSSPRGHDRSASSTIN